MEKAKVGRPLKYTPEELKIYKNIQHLPSNENHNEVLIFNDYNKLISNEFKKEKNIEQWIVDNIDSFAKEILNDEIISFECDMAIEKQIRWSPRGRRIDLFIIGKKKKYIIELKNPKSGSENRAAIGQLLDYGREFSDSKKELIIITSKFDINTARTIKYYDLPIRYIYLDKTRFMEYLGDKK